MDLSIVIVGHNHRHQLEKTLGSLYHSQHRVHFEVILVDNKSEDGTAQMVSSSYPDVQIIQNEQSFGFAKNVNLGLRVARAGRYVLLLNPDVQVMPGALEALTAFMDEHSRVGIAGPKLLNPDLTIQYSCRRYSHPVVPMMRFLELDRLLADNKILRKELMSDWDHNTSCEVDYVIGACMIVHREAMAQVGLMDEAFFLYCEDQDWCLRMWQCGWKVYYLPDAVMIHDHLQESRRRFFGKAQRAHAQSLFLLFKKHGLRIRRPILA